VRCQIRGDWHSIDPVDCANQTRDRKLFCSNELGRPTRMKRRGRDSLRALSATLCHQCVYAVIILAAITYARLAGPCRSRLFLVVEVLHRDKSGTSFPPSRWSDHHGPALLDLPAGLGVSTSCRPCSRGAGFLPHNGVVPAAAPKSMPNDFSFSIKPTGRSTLSSPSSTDCCQLLRPDA
jgi:hypothetical protein